jgi:hypothetical protein
MALSHSVGITFSNSGGPAQNFTASQTADGSSAAEVVIAPAASGFAVIFPIDASQVKSIVMWADAAMTVLTKNSGGSTVNTFALVANKPLIWQDGFPTTNPITNDCATLAVSSTPGGNLYVYVLEDV